MQDRSLSIRTTDAIFHNAVLKCSKTVILEISDAKVEIVKFLMALVCGSEKGRAICKLRFMLMHIFGRINVERCNLRMNTLASRAVLNFVEKASLLVSKEILCEESFWYRKGL